MATKKQSRKPEKSIAKKTSTVEAEISEIVAGAVRAALDAYGQPVITGAMNGTVLNREVDLETEYLRLSTASQYAPKPPTSPPGFLLCERLEAEVDELQAVCQALFDRTAHILRSSEQSRADADIRDAIPAESGVPHSDLGEKLEYQRDRIRRLRLDLRDLTTALAI